MVSTPHEVDYRDGRPRTISVALHRQGRWQPCGHIEFNSAANTGHFAYLPDYDGPPLDPVNLNYRRAGQRVFPVDARTNQDLLHRVMVDRLPGPWGLSVLQSEFPALRTMRACEKLHWFGSRTVGSLAFYVKQFADEYPVHGIDRLEVIRRQSVDLYLRRIERLGLSPQALEGLAAYGGARPKCMFADHAGGQWLAKFNVDTDYYNFAKVEHGIAILAKRCGIRAVDTKALPVAPGADVLFVRRYDHHGEARPHSISAFAMMREDLVKRQSDGDYKMVFDLVDRVCCDPQREREELFRRMLFNLAVNNTDDHAKNVEFLLDDEAQCLRLSPAFDVTVDPYPNPHVMSVFGMTRPVLDNQSIDHIVRELGGRIEQGHAYRLRDEILGEVRHWREVLAATGVAPADIESMSRGIEHVLQRSETTARPAATGRIGR